MSDTAPGSARETDQARVADELENLARQLRAGSATVEKYRAETTAGVSVKAVRMRYKLTVQIEPRPKPGGSGGEHGV